MAKIPVSDLLAHRDGEHIDPELSAEIEADPESRARLQVLREIKHALNELPGIDPADPPTWRSSVMPDADTMNARELIGDWLSIGDIPILLGDVETNLTQNGVAL